MSLIDSLKELGVDTDDGLKRFMNNAPLYEKMLKKLPKHVRELEVMPCFECDDYKKALENAHTLKGVMGNLSISPLYVAYTDIVTLLREDNPDSAKHVLADVLPTQERIIYCIEHNA